MSDGITTERITTFTLYFGDIGLSTRSSPLLKSPRFRTPLAFS
jgi:hypothetical protein